MNDGRSDSALPERAPGPRASDDDRQQVATRLRDAAGEGLLGLDELEDRLSAAFSARTLGELVPLTADLPDTRPSAPPERAPSGRGSFLSHPAFDNDGFRHHFTIYALTIAMLIGIWLLSGAGHFWPFYPAAGWGIGLGSHFQGVAAGARRREQRETGDEPDRRAEQLRRRAERKELRHGIADRLELPKKIEMPGVSIDLDEMLGRSKKLPAEPAPPTPAAAATPAAPPAMPGQPATPDPGAAATDAVAESVGPTRRFVVAMFVDVVNSTQLNEALGDERWSAVRRAFQKQVDDCSTRAGGWQANTTGDGVLMRFEEPRGAAEAAVDLLRRLRRQQDDTGFAPSVRVGIHSGDAVDEGQDIIGNVVNLAARVTSAAEPDQILVTEHVADHLGSGFDTAGRGLHTLKGVGQPRHLLEVRWR